jgi:hypothetical protein
MIRILYSAMGFAAGGLFVSIASMQHNPIWRYNESEDEQFVTAKNDLLSRATNPTEKAWIRDYMHPNGCGMKYDWRWVERLFGSQPNLVTIWWDEDRQVNLRALVRSDGKLLSHCDRTIKTRYPEDSVLSARVVDGYLVGTDFMANYYPGKGKYKIYQYDD